MEQQNYVEIAGNLESEFEFSHTAFGKNFFTATIGSPRKSGIIDHIPLITSASDVPTNFKKGDMIKATGSLRSIHMLGDDNQYHLHVHVFSTSLERGIAPLNHVEIFGNIFEISPIRTTPLTGRNITDFIIITRKGGKRFCRIPCIAWERVAYFVSHLAPGREVVVKGRVQSRTYQKEGQEEERKILELSSGLILW